MKATLAEAAATGSVRHGHVIKVPVRAEIPYTLVALLSVAAFCLYWLSALILAARQQTHLFGADTVLYAELAKGSVIERLGVYYPFDRITRFHPLTTAMAVVWMKALDPLTQWISPQQLLKGMFAAVGAVGVGAATAAFAAVVPRRQVALWGMIYAASFSVWYFSSIEESKIVTATLAAAYIAVYLHLRERWSARGAVLLTAILLLACLNEIITAFLVAMPVADTLMQRCWDPHHGRWIIWHGLAPPIAFAFLEAVVKPHTGGVTMEGPAGEGASHLSMLMFYVSQNDFSAVTLYSFVVNWLFFSIAAPTVKTSLAPAEWPEYAGYFEVALRHYFSSPISTGLVALFGIMAAASIKAWRRREDGGKRTAVVTALLGYALLRGTFWFIVNPSECLLFSAGTTLAHLLVFAIPFANSKMPGKPAILAACALLLFVTNGTFMMGD